MALARRGPFFVWPHLGFEHPRPMGRLFDRQAFGVFNQTLYEPFMGVPTNPRAS